MPPDQRSFSQLAHIAGEVVDEGIVVVDQKNQVASPQSPVASPVKQLV
jgi:hypothetical protein